MKTGRHILWLTAYLACAAGLVLVIVGGVGNQNAANFDYEGSIAGYYEMLLARFHSADAVAKLGAAVFSVGAVLMLGTFFAGWRQRRHSCP